MAESPETHANLAALRADVEYIRNLVTLDIAANPQSKEYVESLLRERKGSAEAYLALNGKAMTQDQMMAALGQSQANVSKLLSHLMENGLIRKVPDPSRKGAFVYVWSDAERVLKVSRIAKRVAG